MARTAAVVAAILAVVCVARAAEFQITRSDSTAIITEDSSPLFNGAIARSSNTLSVLSGAVEWFDVPTAVLIGDLPAALATEAANLQSADSRLNFSAVGGGVFEANFGSSAPIVTYIGTASGVSFTCTGSILRIAPGAFTCASFSTADTAEITISSAAAATVNTTSTGAARNLWLSLAFARTQRLAEGVDDRAVVESLNAQRRDGNRTAVPVLWMILAIAMMCLIVIFAVWASYVVTIFRFWPVFWWALVALVLLIVVSVFGGLAGWVILGLVLFVLSVFMNLFYCCCVLRGKSRAELKGSAAVELGGVNDAADDESEIGQAVAVPKNFTRQPEKLGRTQKRAIVCLAVAITLLSAAFLIGFLAVWSVDEYRVYDRVEGAPVVEFQPSLIQKAVASVYSYERFADNLQMQWFFTIATDYCGEYYNEILTTDSEKKTRIFDAFIDQYGIDMSIYDPSDFRLYNSTNEWFKRPLLPGVRPITAVGDPTISVSPADARVVAFPNVPPDQRVWIKGRGFTLRELAGKNDPSYDTGSLIVVRLAPQDYHRFHSPVTGTVVEQFALDGGLHSVNADAMTSNNGAIYNRRVITIIDSAEFGNVTYVAIGAVCTGSVVMTVDVGDSVTKGDEVGFFQFGGSTVALIYPENSIVFDQDIVDNTRLAVETYLHIGNRIGVTA